MNRLNYIYDGKTIFEAYLLGISLLYQTLNLLVSVKSANPDQDPQSRTRPTIQTKSHNTDQDP